MTPSTKVIIDELMYQLQNMYGSVSGSGVVYSKQMEADKVRQLFYRLADSIKQDAIEP